MDEDKNVSKITMSINEIGLGSMTIDGQHIVGCTGFDVHSRINEVPKITLYLNAEISVEMDSKIRKIINYFKKIESMESNHGQE